MPPGGARPGSGRPKGVKNKKTLELEAARAYLRERVLARIAPLANAYLAAAEGGLRMYTVGEGGRRVLVTDPDQIESLLNTPEKRNGVDYWCLVADKPDTKILQNVFDREFGQAAKPIELTGKDAGPVLIKFVDADAPAKAKAKNS